MATAAADAIFVDTNVLIAANVVTHPKHAVALDRLKEFGAAGVELCPRCKHRRHDAGE